MEMENQCNVCDKKFESPFQLMEHRMKKCKAKKCQDCGATFQKHTTLLNHLKNRKDIVCTCCSKKFCSNVHLNQHLNSMKEPPKDDVDLDQRIQPHTGYEDTDGFQAVIKANSRDIKDRTVTSLNHLVINCEIDPTFTYLELGDIISNIYNDRQYAFKLNLSFGYVIFETKTNEYRYHYNSSNSELFDKGFTVTDHEDLDKLMKKIVGLDLATNYYLSRPNSSSVMAGLTNVEIEIFDLENVPIGAPPY